MKTKFSLFLIWSNYSTGEEMVIEMPVDQEDDTRKKLLAAARKQFAERGFYGASIALIAGEVGLTKQALLYHFKRKEDLYAEVLKSMSGRLVKGVREVADQSTSPAQRFEDMILAMYHMALENPIDNKILLRELLDNQRQDAPQEQWFFKDWLDEMVAMLETVEGQAALPFADKIARIYLLVSAIQFYKASRTVLTRYYGAETYKEIGEYYPKELVALVRRLLANGSE